eukprot:11039090-Ditylum_brightwellii.AAC.1
MDEYAPNKAPKKDSTITNEEDQKEIWQIDVKEKRIRSAINILMLAGGEGVLQPKLDQATKSSGFDKATAEEFTTVFFMYQSDQQIFGDRLLTYEQKDEDGNGDSYLKKMGTAYKVFAHHQAHQGSNIPRRY